MKKPGRPPKLTFELKQRICDLIRAGNSLESAAGAVGVYRTTLSHWILRGKTEGTGIYADFARASEESREFAKVRLISKISKAADQNWNAAAWILERRWPKEFARRTVVQVDMDRAQQALAKLKTKVSPESYEAFLDALSEEEDESSPAFGL